jgi:starch phosphorylase
MQLDLHPPRQNQEDMVSSNEVVIDSLKSLLPKRINKLGELAYNLWWTWKPEAQALFQYIDPVCWEDVYHNPIKLLRGVPRKTLTGLAKDKRFLEAYERVMNDFAAYMTEPTKRTTWYHKTYGSWRGPVAYFSFEFGLHEVLPMYAGGLGILAGDHLKEASDIGIPLIGVGFLYLQGYFRQRITEDGWQEAINEPLDFAQMPITQVCDENGDPVTVNIDIAGRAIYFHLWKAQVGRVPLYLLDTDLPENRPQDRTLTQRLYSPDPDTRVNQEIVLGIGGVRALRALKINPAVWHMNEGHPAFSVLERARELIQNRKMTFAKAKEQIVKSTVFTTHTPVPAGNDHFPVWQIDRHLNGFWDELKMSRDEFMALGDEGGSYGMTPLALRMSSKANGVSELHGEVAQEMWQWMYPGQPTPIGYITNGVHTFTWLGRRNRRLMDEYLGTRWTDKLDDTEMWQQLREVPDDQLWTVRKHYKRRLSDFMRDRARRKWVTHTQHPVQTIASGLLLDPLALTIGFARRFATYKRASLILRDIPRLMKLLNDPLRPVQIVYAGKAHPNDEPGKRLIQELYRTIKNADTAGRMVFIEDYDMNVARYLVQGVDVWMNTPRRPYEASGTSGMKAALNGGINFSILDGWWRESYNGKNGWAIGEERAYDNTDEQDQADSESLFNILENEIVPLYYERDESGIPHAWLEWVKESMITVAPQFSTRRMVKQYANEMYAPLMES